jgi:hypothetical protein
MSARLVERAMNKLRVVAGVPLLQGRPVETGRLELSGELPDRVQDPVAVALAAHEIVVHERRKSVQVRLRDLLRGLEIEAPDEDRKARQELPGRRLEKGRRSTGSSLGVFAVASAGRAVRSSGG